jgi:phosphate transport system substrate-binding protein
MMYRLARTIVFGLALISCLSACGSAATTPAREATPVPAAGAPPTAAITSSTTVPGALPEVDPATVAGAISIAGSSTVFPLTAAVVEEFRAGGSSAQISVDSIGTGAGFKRFCGETDLDIVDASRAITAAEQEQCAARGRQVVEFRVGMDALAVVVHQENRFLTSVSFTQLAAIFTGAAKTWADVDPSYPREPIQLFSPGADSGTFDYFVETVLAGDATTMASTAQLSEDDNELVAGVAGNPYAIGYFGFAYYQENQERLKVLTIDGGKGPITPTAATVADGSYPLARPLFIYSTTEVLQQKPHVAAFINFYLTHVNELITEVGYFPVTPEALHQAQQTFLKATRPST